MSISAFIQILWWRSLIVANISTVATGRRPVFDDAQRRVYSRTNSALFAGSQPRRLLGSAA